jgi:hypothetical protein
VWTRYREDGVYGRFSVPGVRTRVYVHKFAYVTFVGEIPLGWHVHHLCRETACCAPHHLQAQSERQHIDLHIRDKRDKRKQKALRDLERRTRDWSLEVRDGQPMRVRVLS